ncbi:hypothetical protein RD792_010384 [Penstemon davidsonii]|uniref:Thymidylate kinase-like domain-containing protein n=1 Tax=Penstemon davidsonii TaxID=160366 RepID=A0ABR0D1P1_9LAMI|nr:hypothetical protein RD792_010384 [Penstemon davidsonii]
MISSYLANKSQLDDHAMYLLFSANRWERKVLELVIQLCVVLFLQAPEAGLLAPDLVIYLDISPNKAAERGGYGDEKYEQLEFRNKVDLSYRTLCDATWNVYNEL